MAEIVNRDWTVVHGFALQPLQRLQTALPSDMLTLTTATHIKDTEDCFINNNTTTTEIPAGNDGIININESGIRSYLDTVVKGTVESTLNGLLDAEADELCKASKYERSPNRQSTRAGHYTRTYHAAAGELKLKIPRLRNMPFETAIIERYRRREASVEESLIEMYIAGVSVRRIEDITQALWGTRVSPHK